MAYNPALYSPQPMPSPMPTAQPWYLQAQQQHAIQPVNGLVSVTGIEGAKAYQMPPNSSMPLFDGNEDLLYVKTTDAAGYPTIKAFRFEPVEQAAATTTPPADYVPRAEFDELVEQVKALAEQPRQTRARRVAENGQ